MMLCPTQEVLKNLKEMTETGCGFVDGLYLIFFYCARVLFPRKTLPIDFLLYRLNTYDFLSAHKNTHIVSNI